MLREVLFYFCFCSSPPACRPCVLVLDFVHVLFSTVIQNKMHRSVFCLQTIEGSSGGLLPPSFYLDLIELFCYPIVGRAIEHLVD